MSELLPPRATGLITEPMLGVKRVAELLGVSVDTVYEMCYSKAAGFPAMKVRGQWRIPPSKLQQWIDRETAAHASDDDVRL